MTLTTQLSKKIKMADQAYHYTTDGFVLEIGTIVLAKMRSYRPWPAVILNSNGRTVFWVRFFGKGSHGSVKKIDCVPFNKSIECVLEFLKAMSSNSHDDYGRSVREAEIALGIPAENSLLNQLN